MTARVSVLMTVYNGERYLAQAVESVLGQTFTDLEFIVRDDGSTDGTAALLQAYAARDPRLVLHLGQPNLGIVRSMNTLFPLARGEFINRHDADDISLPDRLAQQVAFLDQHPSVGVLGTPVELIDGEGMPIARKPYFSQATDNGVIQEQLLLGCCFCQGSVLFRRACLEQVGLYDETLEQAEDYDLWLRLAEVTELANLTPVLYRYRRHPEGISRRRYAQQTLNAAQVIEKALKRRYGQALAELQRLPVARRYVASALASFTGGVSQQAASQVAHAVSLAPELVQAGSHLPEDVLVFTRRYTAPVALQAASQLFDQLPASPTISGWRKHVLSRIHIREVFDNAGGADCNCLDQHLWAAVRHDPTWLRNRGVWVRLGRSFLHRAQEWASGAARRA